MGQKSNRISPLNGRIATSFFFIFFKRRLFDLGASGVPTVVRTSCSQILPVDKGLSRA